jgi:hypothetical protein
MRHRPALKRLDQCLWKLKNLEIDAPAEFAFGVAGKAAYRGRDDIGRNTAANMSDRRDK